MGCGCKGGCPAMTAVEHVQVTLTRMTDQMASMNGSRLAGAMPRELNGSGSQVVSSSAGRLAGYSLRESSGSDAATVKIRDGFDSGGLLLASIALDSKGSTVQWLMPQGVGFSYGLYLEVSGAVEGAVWLGPIR